MKTEEQKNQPPRPLIYFFRDLEDPRLGRNIRHNFSDIITMAICAVIANANDWNEIEIWGLCKEEWLKTWLFLPNGIPSHDTFNRVFSAINPRHFMQCFGAWVQNIIACIEGVVVSIDGKRVRRSYDTNFGKSALHLVSAWASELNLSLGQVKTNEKSNEITAIPELLDMLLLKGAIVTIDAMGCQKNIAEKIINKGAHYVLALKNNHADLYDDIKTYFDEVEKNGFTDPHVTSYREIEKDHGRIEKRAIFVTDFIQWLSAKVFWKGLKTIVMVISERTIRGKKSTEKRYFISSVAPDPKTLGRYIRSHWSIENTLHWQLDVNFKEDQSRARNKNSAENFAAIRRMTLSLLKQETSKKISLKNKRLLAGWDNSYLLKIIGTKPF
jgi:predicted transposase YbfD/YdcC